MISFEKPSSVKKFSQDLLAEVKHRNQYGACELINVLKHGVYRFVFTSTSRHCCPRTPEINSKNKTERKETKSPQPTPPDRHCRWAISNNKIQLKSETKSLHDEKAPTLDQPTVEKSLKKKSELLQRIRVPLCFRNFHLLLIASCGNASKTLGYSMYGQERGEREPRL